MLRVNRSRRCHPKIGLWEFETDHPKMCWLGLLIILSRMHWKNTKCLERLSLNTPHLPEDRPSEGTGGHLSPPWSLAGQDNGRLSQARRLDVYPPQTLSAMATSPQCSSQGPASPKVMIPHFPMEMAFNLEFYATLGSYSFSLGLSCVHRKCVC